MSSITNFAGEFIFSMHGMDDQIVSVRHCGQNYVLKVKDRFDRLHLLQSRAVGYNVTEFSSKQSGARVVVEGCWRCSFFEDPSGRKYLISVFNEQARPQT